MISRFVLIEIMSKKNGFFQSLMWSEFLAKALIRNLIGEAKTTIKNGRE